MNIKQTSQVSLALFIIYAVLYYGTTPTTTSDDIIAVVSLIWFISYGVLVYKTLKA